MQFNIVKDPQSRTEPVVDLRFFLSGDSKIVSIQVHQEDGSWKSIFSFSEKGIYRHKLLDRTRGFALDENKSNVIKEQLEVTNL